MPKLNHVLFAGIAALALTPPARADTDAPPHHPSHVDEVVVTASPLGASQFDVLQGTSILHGEDLAKIGGRSLGDVVGNLPGVSQTGYTFGASRPVIRGLGGDRIRVLIDGLGSFDASTASPDHAPSVDTATAKRIEVVRGPATLLYGNSAAGGVVNVIDGRIPEEIPENGIEASGTGFYGTNGDERTGSGGVTVALGETGLVAHLDGSYKKTGDMTVPGFARSEALRALDPQDDELRGKLPNSAVRDASITGGLSWVGDNGFLGASVSHYSTNYGIPVNIEEPGEPPEVRIAMQQTRVDVSGELRTPFLAFDTARVRFGYGDYQHAEKEGEEIGTQFFNKQWEGRLELVQKKWGNLSGAWGVQASHRDFEVVGDEAFVAPSLTDQIGVFTVQRLDIGAVALEAGLRFESQQLKADDNGYNRDFGTLSASAGASYTFAENWLAGISAYRTERAPTAEEVLANGPHAATFTFERGDLTLGKETATGVEATLKKSQGPFTGSLNAYYTAYDDFISEQFTGEEEDGLRVVQFTPVSARFYGFEAEAAVEVWRGGNASLKLDAQADYVRAQDTTNGQPLPRIPPLRLTGGVEYAEIRYSTSFLKDYLPAAGRSIRLGIRAAI